MAFDLMSVLAIIGLIVGIIVGFRVKKLSVMGLLIALGLFWTVGPSLGVIGVLLGVDALNSLFSWITLLVANFGLGAAVIMVLTGLKELF